MTATVIPTRFQLRRDTAANWAAANPVLFAGEPALETDSGLRKVGDGVTAWNSLLYQLSGPAYDFAHLADGDTPIWDGTNKRWNHGPGGKVYQAGVGIAIANPTTATPTISNTLGSIALSGNPTNYAALPTGLGAGDAGKAYLLQSDGLIYIWSGTAFPASGSGVYVGPQIVATLTLASDQPSVTFSGFAPGSEFVLDFAVSGSGSMAAGIQLNGDSAFANYASQQMVSVGSTTYTARITTTQIPAITLAGSAASTVGQARIVQTGQRALMVVTKAGNYSGLTNVAAYAPTAIMWSGTALISAIKIIDPAVNLAAGSYFRLTRVR